MNDARHGEAGPTDAERERLWPEFLAFYPGYATFSERAHPRVIPIVILEPRTPR